MHSDIFTIWFYLFKFLRLHTQQQHQWHVFPSGPQPSSSCSSHQEMKRQEASSDKQENRHPKECRGKMSVTYGHMVFLLEAKPRLNLRPSSVHPELSYLTLNTLSLTAISAVSAASAVSATSGVWAPQFQRKSQCWLLGVKWFLLSWQNVALKTYLQRYGLGFLHSNIRILCHLSRGQPCVPALL